MAEQGALRSVCSRVRNLLTRRGARDELAEFNLRTGNNIQSRSVALCSIVGKGIAVLPDAHVDRHCQLGSYSYVGSYCFVTRAVIGRYVGIGNYVSIGPGEHHTNRASNSALFYENAYDQLTNAPCTIGPDAWIGVGSVVRRGVSIGMGAIVGANSFVNKDVPPFGIVVGSPARFIRYRVSPDHAQLILNSKWWELDIEDARELISDLNRRMGLTV